ncbi:MAG: hypothetical protein ACTSVY_10425 [Candidatus Helarchaeota archaeon]
MKINENLNKFLDYVNIFFIIFELILGGALILESVNFTTQYSALILCNLIIIGITFGYSWKIKETAELADYKRISKRLFFEWFVLSAFIIFITLFFFTLPFPNT